MKDALGIIAGNGEFPQIMARAARQLGAGRLIAVAIEGETDRSIEKLVDEVEWIKLGQLNKLIQAFTSRGVTRAVMAGGVTPSNLFKNLSFDMRMIGVAARLKERNAESIFGAIASEMSKDGVELVDPRSLLGDSIPGPGPLTRRKPSEDEEDEITFGLRISKAVGQLDIGQTVVVKQGTVLAVEGLEGTDECIRRGGSLAGVNGGAVVVKVSKPKQDFRFDIPCVGQRTVDSCVAGKIAVLAIEAGGTLLLDKEAILQAADKRGLCIIAVAA